MLDNQSGVMYDLAMILIILACPWLLFFLID